MLDWNPSHHTRHAWDTTKTVWGKIALVLFYSFIWLNILSALVSVIWPASQGMQCMLNLAGQAPAQTLLVAAVRAMNIFVIGFLSYADVGGLKTKNVALVTVIFTLWAVSLTPSVPMAVEAGCMIYYQLYLFPGWLLLALLFTILEDKLGDHGTTAETQSLVV